MRENVKKMESVMSCYETEVVFPIYGNRLCPQKKMESVCFKGILLVVFMEPGIF